MIEVKKEGILLKKTRNPFENEGVLNPAVIKQGETVHVFYRAVHTGNNSTIGYSRLNGPLKIAERWNKPIMFPEFDYETRGVEDARIVLIDGLFYMTYTAYDGTNARGALAISRDLLHFEKHGLIVPSITYEKFVQQASLSNHVHPKYFRNQYFYYQIPRPEIKILLWDKNVMFFPRRIDGKLVFLHRIRPGIQVVSVKDLTDLTPEFWTEYFLNFHKYIALDPVYPHESSYIGGGCPPIETEYGWLLIYHGVREIKNGRIYSASAALLDLNNPVKEIARLPYFLLSPEHDWEIKGEVNNVVFPTGAAIFGDILYIYYGAADERIACASLSMSSLLEELNKNRRKDEKHYS